jgi:Suppressor of fused protein (SUFU)
MVRLGANDKANIRSAARSAKTGGVWAERMAGLEAILGKPTGKVGHAPVPFDLGFDVGGGADVVFFRSKPRGTIAVTAELTGRTDQKASALGNYELMMAERKKSDWAANLISRLAYYTLEEPLESGDTMELGDAAPERSNLVGLLFDNYGKFVLRRKRCGVLLCIGITNREMRACQAGKGEQVLAALKASGVYPFTEFSRKTVV